MVVNMSEKVDAKAVETASQRSGDPEHATGIEEDERLSIKTKVAVFVRANMKHSEA
jgi:hypothetical protein